MLLRLAPPETVAAQAGDAWPTLKAVQKIELRSPAHTETRPPR
jgi:hypothetical protein